MRTMKSTRGLRRSLAALPAQPQATRLIARAMARGAFADALRMLRTAGLQPDRRNEKVLSRKYNFVCICIPKVASHSLTVALSWSLRRSTALLPKQRSSSLQTESTDLCLQKASANENRTRVSSR